MRSAWSVLSGLLSRWRRSDAPRDAPPIDRRPTNAGSAVPGPQVSGVWDAVTSATIDEGVGAGDTRIEKQEWHLSQSGSAIRGYYIAALTFVSGDGRPYVCSRQPQFSALQRFDVAGRVQAGAIEIQEMGQAENADGEPLRPGDAPAGALPRPARRRRADAGQRPASRRGSTASTTARRRDAGRAPAADATPTARARPRRRRSDRVAGPSGAMAPMPPRCRGVATADVSGLWVWEHQGTVPGRRREAGARGVARRRRTARSSPATTIASSTRSRPTATPTAAAWRSSSRSRPATSSAARSAATRCASIESSYEVLSPSACDNGKRRLDAYEGQASADEIRLVWGVGGQILRRPRPTCRPSGSSASVS